MYLLNIPLKIKMNNHSPVSDYAPALSSNDCIEFHLSLQIVVIILILIQVRWKVVAWHPDVATQLCLASEEDANPVIQLWDLRFATTPIKTFEGHQK